MKLLLTLAFAVAGWGLASLSTATEASAAEAVKEAPEVIMYSTQTCSYCAKARALFTSRNIAWDERDIETSAEANKEWKELGGVGTPLILINGKRFSGFVEAQIDAELTKVR
ncbi:MAG TPA: glutaredoxin family protein [Dokdonella sp.]|uniref:glutaredoxin family protein n=1 Tax=Dokdonella sp. TaxID=2291710 RepID=UPI002D7F48C8|nr:glutaredoxin family protein [Dokdonella sp.]HET9032454.1 glutaredoxin family protein [Dokdonella sp.]